MARFGPARKMTFVIAVAVVIAGIPTSIASGATPASRQSSTAARILVGFQPGTAAAERSHAAESNGGRVVGRIAQLDVDIVEVPAAQRADAIARLERNPNVTYAEADAIVEASDVVPNDARWGYQWSPKKTRATAAWGTTTGASTTTIAILDTGVNAVADLQAKLLTGRNVMNGTADVTDTHGHGTMSAGVAGASTNNAAGVAGYCWACRILPVKVMETSTGMVSNLAAGITWAADAGANVISMSLSASSGTTTLQSAVRYATDRGAVLVAAAGNNGNTTPRYPAAYAEVLGVAGTDSNDARYTWSNYGSWVDVAAPGVNESTTKDGTYSSYAGTSSAAPVVAGIAGLALSLPSQPTAAQVVAAIESGAVPVNGIARAGRVDAASTLAALGAVAPAPPAAVAPSITITSPANGATVDASVTVTGTATSNDAAAISKVEVVLGTATQLASGTSSWSKTLDTSALPNGTHRITARATTSSGATATATVDVTVQHAAAPAPAPAPEPSQPTLTVTASKAKGGYAVASLSWSAALGAPATIYRDGAAIATVTSGTSYQDSTGEKGGVRHTYRVCGSTSCSSEVAVAW